MRCSAIPPLGLVSLLLVPACLETTYKDTHCSNNDGDAFCRREHPGYERPYCTLDCAPEVVDGCVEAEPAPSCYSPCGGRVSIADDPACEPVPLPDDTETGTTSQTEDTASGTSSTGDSSESTTGPQPCSENDDCTDGAAPFCEPSSGACVACDGTDEPDSACAGLDPSAPLCVRGVCVQCTAAAPEACAAETPVCDEATHTCVPCTAHDQCGDAACNLFTGACLPGDAVVHAGPGQEFASLSLAIGSFAAGAEGTIVVHDASYDESASVGGGRVLAFVANGTEVPRWVRTSGSSPQLTVMDGTVLMDGIQVSGNASTMVPGILVDGGRVWVDRGRIVGNDGGAIVAQSAAELVLRNCFVGDGTNGANALTIDGTASMVSARVTYTTLGAGFDNFADAFAILCSGPVDVTVRNSLLVSLDNATGEISCSMATVTNSASETLIPGTGNVALGDVGVSWFTDINAGNFHLQAPPVAVGTTARWQTGDPATDLDGQLRPTLDGDADFAGADVP